MIWNQISSAPARQEVLVFDDGIICVARMEPDIWDENDEPIWIVGYGAEYGPKPSHWMPLPDPPER